MVLATKDVLVERNILALEDEIKATDTGPAEDDIVDADFEDLDDDKRR